MKFHHLGPLWKIFMFTCGNIHEWSPLEEKFPTHMITITKCQLSADANNCDLQNVECQSLIPSGKFSLGSPKFAK